MSWPGLSRAVHVLWFRHKKDVGCAAQGGHDALKGFLHDSPAAAALPAVLDRIDAELDNSLGRLFDFLKIQSVSTDPAYAPHCKAAAEFVANDLASLGFDATLRPTGGHPVVIGKSRNGNGSGGVPHVLFYGHYDVQPVDPLSLWETPPFEPRIAQTPDGRKIIVARGACDDKGQVMTFVEALPRLQGGDRRDPDPDHHDDRRRGGMRLRASVRLRQGQRRRASTQDFALVCDTSMWDARHRRSPPRCAASSMRRCASPAPTATCIPACSAARRRIRCACSSQILGAMHDKNGKVTIPGFYDGVKELPKDIKAELAKLKLTPKEFLGGVGLKIPAGEKNRMLIEQIATPPDRRDQRHDRRLHRRRRQDRAAGAGDREGVVPAGRRPEPEEDPGGVPQIRARAAAGRRQGRVHELRARARDPAAVRQSGAGAGRARRSRPNGARPR